MDFLHLSIKLLTGFLCLFFVTKYIGGREVKQLTVFDFISAIVLSELVGNVLYSSDTTVLHMLFAISLWAFLIIMVDKLTLRSMRARRFLDGEPDLIIDEGCIARDVLKKHNLDLNELLSLLRQQEIFSIREVAFAYLEPNGSLSILRSLADDVEKNQKPLPVLPAILILDGSLKISFLGRLNKNREWLEQELSAQGIDSPEQVFYAEYVEGRGLFVQRKD